MLTAVCPAKPPGSERKLIIVGLTFAQLRRLMAGDPISENLVPIGLDAQLFAFAGADADAIVRILGVHFPGLKVMPPAPPADAGA
jgi:hypothetical protein